MNLNILRKALVLYKTNTDKYTLKKDGVRIIHQNCIWEIRNLNLCRIAVVLNDKLVICRLLWRYALVLRTFT